jgi:hypothetical protein
MKHWYGHQKCRQFGRQGPHRWVEEHLKRHLKLDLEELVGSDPEELVEQAVENLGQRVLQEFPWKKALPQRLGVLEQLDCYR